MPFVKLEYIYKLMEEKELPYFKVTDGKTLIAKNNEESEPTKAVQQLTDVIEMIEDSIICISLSDKTDKERSKGGSNWDNYSFKVKLRPQGEGINGAAGSLNNLVLTMLKENADLLKRIELQAKEHELTELKKQIAELKDKKDKPDLLEKYLPLLATHFGSGKPVAGIAGAEDEPINDEAAAKAMRQAGKMKKIKDAIARLAKVDPLLPDTLTMLADFAEKKPDQYKGFIPILKSQMG